MLCIQVIPLRKQTPQQRRREELLRALQEIAECREDLSRAEALVLAELAG